MFERTLENTIREKINGGKAIVIVGARQVGKTTLLNEILKG
jgi:predicted AAA+ superfamily ATPase